MQGQKINSKSKWFPLLKSVFFFLILIIHSSKSWSAYSNYNSILIGDQAAGMGGAYTAMDTDASALSYFNPASLARLKGESFSASVGIYKKFDTVFGKSEDITSAALRANIGFFRSLPSSTGSVVRFKNFFPDYTFALTIVVPEYDFFKGDVYKNQNIQSTLSLTDESLWVGGAVAKEINETMSLGLTLYYTARNFSRTINSRALVSSTQLKSYVEERDFKQNAIVAILGYFWKFSDYWKWGLSWRTPAVPIGGTGTYYHTQMDSGTILSSYSPSEIQTTAYIPQKIALGLSYEFKGLLLLSMDLTYHEGISYDDVSDSRISERIEHKPVWNMSLGSQFDFFPYLKVRAGLYTNFSSHNKPDPQTSKSQRDSVDQLGFSANATLISGNIQYTFGGYYTGGRGHSVQRTNETLSNPYELLEKTEQVFTMLVGTSYSF